MKHDYTIEMEHIILSPMDIDTSEAYRVLRNREDNRDFFFHSALISKDQQESWFCRYLQKESECMFAVRLKESGTFLGGIGIYNIDSNNASAEVGRIIIDRNLAGGKGYGTEAIKGVLEVSRNYLRLKEIYAFIYSENAASRKAFLRAGFSECNDSSQQKDSVKVQYRL